jgi:hypothetical protein
MVDHTRPDTFVELWRPVWEGFFGLCFVALASAIALAILLVIAAVLIWSAGIVFPG